MIEVKAIKLPWYEVSKFIGDEAGKILERELVCKANVDDHDYWATRFPEERIPLSELFKLMETVNADANQREESLPESARKEFTAKEIGLGISELLLSRHIGLTWTAFYLDKENLWLLDVKEVVQNET